jgi:hypothetical protein
MELDEHLEDAVEGAIKTNLTNAPRKSKPRSRRPPPKAGAAYRSAVPASFLHSLA